MFQEVIYKDNFFIWSNWTHFTVWEHSKVKWIVHCHRKKDNFELFDVFQISKILSIGLYIKQFYYSCSSAIFHLSFNNVCRCNCQKPNSEILLHTPATEKGSVDTPTYANIFLPTNKILLLNELSFMFADFDHAQSEV